MSDVEFHWAEYIKASSEALVLLKTLYPLLPQGGGEIEGKIEAAEQALQAANVTLAKNWGFELHDCAFPPKIMLWDNNIKDRVCPGCGFRQKGDRTFPTVNRGPRGGSWMGS
jgi:hypothetical protein